jgi:hypothetical protein
MAGTAGDARIRERAGGESPVKRPLGLARLEDHHRDLAVGLGLELVVGRPSRGHDAPQLGLLLGRGDSRPSGVLVGLDLQATIGSS